MNDKHLISFKAMNKRMKKIALQGAKEGHLNVFAKNPITGQIICVSQEMVKRIAQGEDVSWDDLVKEIN